MKSFIATGTRHGHGGRHSISPLHFPGRLRTDETLRQRVDTRFPVTFATREKFRPHAPLIQSQCVHVQDEVFPSPAGLL